MFAISRSGFDGKNAGQQQSMRRLSMTFLFKREVAELPVQGLVQQHEISQAMQKSGREFFFQAINVASGGFGQDVVDLWA